MNKEIIDRLAFLLDSIYPDIPFSETQDIQGIEPPRFFVTCYHNEVKPRIQTAGIFYFSRFDLVFDPGADEVEERCNQVAQTLLPIIQKIPKGDGTNYRANNIESEFDSEQGLLHIFFDVTTPLHEEQTEDIPDIKRIYEQTDVEVV